MSNDLPAGSIIIPPSGTYELERSGYGVQSSYGSGYTAAKSSRYRKWFGDGGIYSEDMSLDEWDRERVISTLHFLSRNSSVVRAIQRVKRLSIVGQGMAVQWQTGEKDYDKELEGRFNAWSENPEPTGRMDLTDILNWQASHVPLIGGDGILSKVRGGFIQPIEGHRIGTSYRNSTVDEESRIQNGVETDAGGRVKAYHVGNRVLGMLKDTQPMSAENALLVGVRERPDQYRYVPQLTSAIAEILDLMEYDEAVILRAKTAAAMGVFIESANPAQHAHSQRGMLGNQKGSDGQPSRLQRIEPGSVNYMRMGEKVHTMNPATTDPNGPEHILGMLRKVGASVGVPAEVILLALADSSFSAVMGLMLHFSEAIRSEQAGVLKPWKRHLLPWLVRQWIARGEVSAPPRGADPFSFRMSLRVMPWVNKKDELAADRGYAQMGVITRADICERHNKDPEEQTRSTAKDIIELAKVADEVNKTLPEGQPKLTWRDFWNPIQTSASSKLGEDAPVDGQGGNNEQR